MYEPLPPFIGTWEQMRGNTIGMGKEKKKERKKDKTRTSKRRQGLLQGANSPFKSVPRSIKPHIVKPKFHKISQ